MATLATAFQDGGYKFRNLLEARACRIIQPDVAHVGGITELRKIASLADAYYVTFCPHEYNGPVTLLAAALSGCEPTRGAAAAR